MTRFVLSLILAAVVVGSIASGCNKSKRIYANCYCPAAPIASVTVTVVTSSACAPCEARDEQEEGEKCRRGRCSHRPYDKDCKRDKKNGRDRD